MNCRPAHCCGVFFFLLEFTRQKKYIVENSGVIAPSYEICKDIRALFIARARSFRLISGRL